MNYTEYKNKQEIISNEFERDSNLLRENFLKKQNKINKEYYDDE